MSNARLWNRNLSLLSIANLISRIGNVVFDVALAWWIVDKTGSVRYMGYIMAASMLAVVLLSPISGVLSDRWNKKYILVATDLISGIVTIFVCIMSYYNIINLPILILVNFVLGISTSIMRPTIKSIIPQLVNKNVLVKANTLTTNIAQMTKVIGPVVASFLITLSYIGIPGAFLFNGLSFFVSATLEANIKFNDIKRTYNHEKFFKSMKDGMHYAYKNVILRNLLILSSIVNISLASYNILLPLYIKNILGASSILYSNVLTVEALGGIIVTILLLSTKEIDPSPKILAYSIGLTGFTLAMISIFPNRMILLSSSFLLGFFLGGFNTLFFSYIQLVVPEELSGRVFSIVYMVAVGVMPISYLIFGFLGDHILKSAFIWSGLSIVLSSIPTFFLERNKNVGKVEATSTGL